MDLKNFTLHLLEVHPEIQKLKDYFYAHDKSVIPPPNFFIDSFSEKFKYLNSNFIKIFQVLDQLPPEQKQEVILHLEQVGRTGPHSLHLLGFYPPVKLLAPDEKLNKWEKLILDGRIVGAYAQTEVAHGSDVQSLQTTATYNHEKKCFVLNTPNLGATKFWVGVMGMHATHIVTQAQTYINGKHYGLQTFIAQIRDSKTYKLLPGVDSGDIGVKLGLPYMDNGYLQLKNYEIPKENLLSKFLKIDEDNKVTVLGDKNAVKIGYGGMLNLRVILIKEFIRDGFKGTLTVYRSYLKANELNSLERRKLLKDFAHIYTGLSTIGEVSRMHRATIQKIKTDLKAGLGELEELHMIVSGFKAFYAMEVVNQTRRFTMDRSLGNLMVAGTAYLYGDRVPAVTYEGDNIVLLQQTARGLCKYMQYVESEKASKVPSSFKFLDEYKELLEKGNEIKVKIQAAEDLTDLNKIEEIINVIGLFAVKENYEKMKQAVMSGESMKKLWNENLQKSMVDMALTIAAGLSFKMAKKNLVHENIGKMVQSVDAEIVKDLLKVHGLNIVERDLEIASRYRIGSDPQGFKNIVNMAKEIVFKRLEKHVEHIGESHPFFEEELCYVRDYKEWAPRDLAKENNAKIFRENAKKMQENLNTLSKL